MMVLRGGPESDRYEHHERGDEFLTLLRSFGQYREIVALDLVEVAPTLDPTHQTTLLAAHGLFGFIEERFLLEPEA